MDHQIVHIVVLEFQADVILVIGLCTTNSHLYCSPSHFLVLPYAYLIVNLLLTSLQKNSIYTYIFSVIVLIIDLRIRIRRIRICLFR